MSLTVVITTEVLYASYQDSLLLGPVRKIGLQYTSCLIFDSYSHSNLQYTLGECFIWVWSTPRPNVNTILIKQTLNMLNYEL